MLYYKCVPAQKARKGTIFFLFIQIKRHKSAKMGDNIVNFKVNLVISIIICIFVVRFYELKVKHTQNENYENEQLFWIIAQWGAICYT